jgi:hypothetical protein
MPSSRIPQANFRVKDRPPERFRLTLDFASPDEKLQEYGKRPDKEMPE